MITPVFHPIDAPFLGLKSKPSPVTLGRGEFDKATNWRLDEDLPKVRLGSTRFGPAVSAIGSSGDYCVGCWHGTLNGVWYMAQAWYLSGAGTVAIYTFTDPLQAGTEVTATSGKYGATRLSGSFVNVSFAPFKDVRTGKEYLCIQDGTSSPRVWDPQESDSNEKVAINQAITLPTVGPTQGVVLTFPKFFTISDHSNTSYSNSGANFTSANTGGSSSTANFAVITIGTSTATNDTTTLTLGSQDLSACPQLVVYYESSYRKLWDNVKLEIVDATANSTIWDGVNSGTTYRMDLVAADTSSSAFFAVFDLSHVASANRDAVTGLKFTWEGASAPSSSQTVNLYMVAGSGKIRGNALHAISYLNQGSRGESAGIHFGSEHYSGEYIRALGASATKLTKLPNDPRIFFQYNINFLNSSSTDRDAGVDALVIYRSDVGEDPAVKSYTETKTIATYSGSWSFSSGSAGSLVSHSDNVATEDRDVSAVAPDANAETIPKGLWMVSANDRLFVLSYESTGSYNAPAYSALWASDYRGVRFRRTHRSELDGTRVAFSGEILTCAIQMPTSAFGVNSLLLFSQSALYRLNATSSTLINRPERVGGYGTWTPYSVVRSNDSVYWLDQNRNVQKYTLGGITNISYGTIQDKLDAVGGSTWNFNTTGNMKGAFAGYYNDRYYLSVDQGGTLSWSNNREQPLVFDALRGVWTEDALGVGTMSTRFWVNGYGRLFAQSKDRYMYWYEATGYTTDGGTLDPVAQGTAHSAVLRTGYGLPGQATGTVYERSDFLVDDATGGSAAVTVNYYPTGVSTANASFDGSTSVVWCTTGAVTISSGSGDGAAVQTQVSFTANSGVGGMRLYQWQNQIATRTKRASSL